MIDERLDQEFPPWQSDSGNFDLFGCELSVEWEGGTDYHFRTWVGEIEVSQVLTEEQNTAIADEIHGQHEC